MPGNHRKKSLVERYEETTAQKQWEVEEKNRRRRVDEQDKREAEVHECLPSPPRSVASSRTEEPHARRSPPLRAPPSETPFPNKSSIQSRQMAESETSRLRAEVSQLREELNQTKARVDSLNDDRERLLEQERIAITQGACEEVDRLKQSVKELDDLLKQATEEKKQLREQLRRSENRVDELEEEARALRREQQLHEQNDDVPQNKEDFKDRSLEKKSEKRPSQQSKSKQFVVTGEATKFIKRPKNGWVPLVLA